MLDTLDKIIAVLLFLGALDIAGIMGLFAIKAAVVLWKGGL